MLQCLLSDWGLSKNETSVRDQCVWLLEVTPRLESPQGFHSNSNQREIRRLGDKVELQRQFILTRVDLQQFHWRGGGGGGATLNLQVLSTVCTGRMQLHSAEGTQLALILACKRDLTKTERETASCCRGPPRRSAEAEHCSWFRSSPSWHRATRQAPVKSASLHVQWDQIRRVKPRSFFNMMRRVERSWTVLRHFCYLCTDAAQRARRVHVHGSRPSNKSCRKRNDDSVWTRSTSESGRLVLASGETKEGMMGTDKAFGAIMSRKRKTTPTKTHFMSSLLKWK